MIDTSGMSSFLALKLVGRERDKFETNIENDPTSKREIAAFRDRIGSIGSVEALTEDFEVFSFVMKSFGFEDQLYAKGMMKKILVTDPAEKSSLASRMNSGAFKVMAETLGFGADGTAPEDFGKAEWVDGMVARYVDQRLIDTQTAVSETVGDGLYFEQHAAGMKSWYSVLADERMSAVVRTALGLPEDIGKANIDAQAKLLSKKMDIEDLQDPEKVQALLSKYAAIEDANTAYMAGQDLIASLFGSSTSSGSWNAVTIDLEALTGWSSPR